MSTQQQAVPITGDDQLVASGVPMAAGTRIDPAHVPNQPPEVDELELPKISASKQGDEAATLVLSLEQVHNQASQLATYLRKQQSAIDRREAELNARTATFDNQMRSARIWLVERQQELETQQAGLEQLRESLGVREATLSAAEKQFAEREDRINQAEAWIAEQRQVIEKAQAILPEFERLEMRNSHVDEAQRRLAAREEELQTQESRLLEERKALHVQQEADRRKIAQQRADMLAEREEEREKLKCRRADLDARESALKQLRTELTGVQQETLEMRVAMEELWSRLQGAVAPAALTSSLAQLRSKLADRQKLARQEIDKHRLELEELAGQLAQQKKQVLGQRKELQQWVRERELEFEAQAAALAAREAELDRQELAFQSREDGWRQERQRYDREILRLLSELRHGVAA